jgi:cytochrome d ubiquinol oxidase subunit I
MKIAALEGMWETELPPASLTIFGIPNTETKTVDYAVKLPWLLGLAATRSFSQPILGINDLVKEAEERIHSGIHAYSALKRLQANRGDTEAKKTFNQHSPNMGYALLLKKFMEDPMKASPEQIKEAAQLTVPSVPAMFYAFRIMVGLGFFFIAYFILAFYLSCKRRLTDHPLFLRLSLCALPAPWIAGELGWFVAEHGRQPWTIEGILPTFLSVSTITASHVWVSLCAFIFFYSIMAVVDFYLIRKYVRIGPDYFRS